MLINFHPKVFKQYLRNGVTHKTTLLFDPSPLFLSPPLLTLSVLVCVLAALFCAQCFVTFVLVNDQILRFAPKPTPFFL